MLFNPLKKQKIALIQCFSILLSSRHKNLVNSLSAHLSVKKTKIVLFLDTFRDILTFDGTPKRVQCTMVCLAHWLRTTALVWRNGHKMQLLLLLFTFLIIFFSHYLLLMTVKPRACYSCALLDIALSKEKAAKWY